MWVIVHLHTISGSCYSFRAKEPFTQEEVTQAKETLETCIDAGKGFYSDENQTVFLRNVEAIVFEGFER